MSATKKQYWFRMIFRCLVLGICTVMYFLTPESFDILDGMNFFKRFSPFHLLWLLWVVDMLQQIIPMKSHIARGSLKLFKNQFHKSKDYPAQEELKKYIKDSNKRAAFVLFVWCLLIGAIGVFYYFGIFRKIELFMISVLFYVFDLVCVLIWCPFRLMMKTRCCSTCRIFNWDHMMMFSPIVFVGGFYAITLVALSLVTLLVWELSLLLHPERFWEKTNSALKCSECTDKLCHRSKHKVHS